MALNDLTTRFTYDTKSLRYRDAQTGRFLSEQVVIDAVEDRIRTGFDELEAYASGAINNSTTYTIADWQAAMADELRRMHVQMLVIGAGGRENVTPAEWGKLGARLRAEYGYLNRFAEDIVSGRATGGQIRNRMGMYADGIWRSFWTGRSATATRESGATHERRIVNAAAENCDDCLGYEAKGWQPIGTLPEPGDKSQCLSRCRCRKQYGIRQPDGTIQKL